jgi:uncharacterized protein YdeI (YjbR/CyaY-like superfamily)
VPKADPPVLTFASADEWEQWLDDHHADPVGVWMKIAKKASGIRSITAPEALDVALCFGWIDGQRRGLDDEWFLQKYTPRRPRSRWSQINRDKATELVAQGRMRASGMRAIEAARADGRWDAAYAPQSSTTVPPDLEAALQANAAAATFFATLDSRNRFAVVHRVEEAKKPETRARRIEQFVAMLARGEKLYA